MTPEQQVTLWFALTVIPFGLNAMLRCSPDAIGVGAMLIVGWCLERVCWLVWTPPEATQLYCVMDAIFGCVVLRAWLDHRAAWKLLLVALLIFQCALAAAFWGSYPTDTAVFLRYIELNNTAYALELAVASFPGVGRVASLVGHWLFGSVDAGRHASP